MGKDENKNILLQLYAMWVCSIYLAVLTREDLVDTIFTTVREVVSPLSVSGILANKEQVFIALLAVTGKWAIQTLVAVLVWGIGKGLLSRKLQNVDCTAVVASIRGQSAHFAMVGIWIEMIWAAFFYASFSIPGSEVLVFIAMQCFAVKIIVDTHSKREWTAIAVLIAFGIVCKLYTDRNFVLRVLLLLIAAKDLDRKKIMKWYLVMNTIASIVIIAVAGVGISGIWMETDAYRTEIETANRYVLGYNSPNTTHYIVIRLALVAMYVWWDKLKGWHIVAFLAVNYGLYILTDSRTGFLVGVAAGLLVIFFQYCKRLRDKKIWYVAGIIFVVALSVFSLSFLRWNFQQYDYAKSCPAWVYRVNSLMVGRIHQMLKFRQGIEFSPFGTYKPGVYIDMGYVKLFLQEGFLAFGLYLTMIIWLIKQQYQTKDYAGYMIVIVISIRMLMESSFVPFVFQNPVFMLVIGWYGMSKQVVQDSTTTERTKNR